MSTRREAQGGSRRRPRADPGAKSGRARPQGTSGELPGPPRSRAASRGDRPAFPDSASCHREPSGPGAQEWDKFNSLRVTSPSRARCRVLPPKLLPRGEDDEGSQPMGSQCPPGSPVGRPVGGDQRQ